MPQYPPAPPPTVVPAHYTVAHADFQRLELKNLEQRYLYVWYSGPPEDGFWMYVNLVSSSTFAGYIWQRSRWVEAQIPIESILRFY